MPRRNGSYYGFTVAPTPSVASGIWRVREAEENLRVNKWPATPGVPGSPVGVPGNAQVSLAWSAPSLGSPPTDYQVQYSSNSGTTWTTFSDGTSTATSAVVTGLTNGTGYIFRVRAVNALGEGPYGSASGTVTPFTPTVLLLHLDGPTSVVDSSPLALAFTSPPGSFNTSTKKFGAASYSVNSLPGLHTTTRGIPDLADGDWTIEAWVYRLSDEAQYSALIFLNAASDNNSYGGGLNFYINSNGVVDLNNGFAAGASSTAGAVPVGQWVHLAAVRSSGTTKLYLNGVANGQTSQAPYPGPYFANIGAVPTAANFSADLLIDELRISAGLAVYTSNFTPPTAPF